MVQTNTLTKFAERLADKNANRAVPEAHVRHAIAGYARCIAVVNGLKRSATERQIERAVRKYHDVHSRLAGQMLLLSA